MPDLSVSLGGYTFSSWGVPERINGGGRQNLAVHQFIGGARTIDAMGWVPERIKFSGRLRGETATSSIRLLETIARIGTPVVFSYWTNRYQVLVAKFIWQFERYYEISYDLTLEVLTDLTQDAWQQITESIDSAVNSDLIYAQSVAATLTQLASGIASITSGLAAIGSLRTATAAAVAPMVAAVSGTIATATRLQASFDAGISVGAVGQVISGGNPSVMAATLVSAATAVPQLVATVSAVAIMTRLRINLGAIGQ